MTGTELIRDLGLDPARRVALLHAETLAMFVAPIMREVARALAPFVWLLRVTVSRPW